MPKSLTPSPKVAIFGSIDARFSRCQVNVVNCLNNGLSTESKHQPGKTNRDASLLWPQKPKASCISPCLQLEMVNVCSALKHWRVDKFDLRRDTVSVSALYEFSLKDKGSLLQLRFHDSSLFCRLAYRATRIARAWTVWTGCNIMLMSAHQTCLVWILHSRVTAANWNDWLKNPKRLMWAYDDNLAIPILWPASWL